MDIVLRASAVFVILYLLLRLLGKRELGQLTPFELLVMIVMGDLIQQGVTHNDFSLTGALLAVATFGFLALLLSWITYLSPAMECLLDGKPRVVIRDGTIIAENLRRDRVTRAELESEMRLAGIASLKDVAWAIIEPQGKISFIKSDGGTLVQKDHNDPI
ncbi:DUF421 domain-containing protein [Sphingosinicella microcystinivorans]|uniref:Uncharacterized protein DUF421 n=1 Tax=Sphingosinicella microcystinivorans TaxID=335406 RepID=A0AAD1G033_SPHMI|nr:YetF domain-containing protein [Sphingosinicella microcystinivorans]RKS90578.1 uncharacterized protein DUF421 [Sphingosinicella microcystinivorans]BBE33492.1 hypothetical protein SmB9_11500 [Sphingosinicella microcystinivorans]